MKDIGLAVAMICIWGSNYAVAKIGLQELPPFLIMALRFLVTALLLLPFVSGWRVRKGPILVYSVIVGLIHFGGVFSALAVSDAAMVIIVSQINVPFSVLIAAVFLGERLEPRHGLGILVALFGVVLYAGDPGMQTTIAGFVYCLIGAAAWSVGLVWMKVRISAPPLAINFWMAAFSVPMLLFASVMAGEQPWTVADRMSPAAAGSVLYQAIGTVVIGYGIWNHLIHKYDVSSVAPLTLLVPFSGLFFAWLILGERLSAQELTGGLLTILGVAILTITRERFARLMPVRQVALAPSLDEERAVQK